MTQLQWGQPGQRQFEQGVSKGVLYLPDVSGEYTNGFAWNGLVTVTESPSGAESNKQYADNRVYANLLSAEEFAATIEAFTYPDEFSVCDGTAIVKPGVYVGQQDRQSFGFSYQTLIGNDLNARAGYKVHMVWGCLAAPSEKANTTVNDSPEAVPFSWELSTSPVEVPGVFNGKTLRPVAHLWVSSLDVAAEDLAALELLLYGGAAVGADPELPSPADVIALFDGVVGP